MTDTATTVAPDDSAVQRLADRLADEFEALVVAAMERVADRFLGDVIADAAPIDEADTRAIIALWAQETPELVAALAEMHATIAAETIARYGPPATDSLVEALRLSYLDRAMPRMTDIGTSLWESSVKTLAEGHAAGEDYRQLRDRLRLTFAADGKELSESRAARIARTEVHAAVNAGTLDGMKALPSDIKPRYKTWLATQDGRTRPDHAAADGQTVQLEDTFLVADEQLAAPGDPMGSAGNVVNCFAGEQRVECVGELIASSAAWYTGELRKLITADGAELTVTPNHPVLTPSGWKSAQSIDEGDQVLRVVAAERAPHVHDGPARIKEVHRSLRQRGATTRIGRGGVDFHGDVPDGDVDVVGAEHLLRSEVDIEVTKVSRQLDLVWRSDGEPCGACARDGLGASASDDLGVTGTCTWCGRRSSRCADGVVRSEGQITSLLRRETLHPEPVGVGAATHGQPELAQPGRDDRTTDAEQRGHPHDAHPLVVEPTQVVRVDVLPGRHRVFNLESSSGLLVADGILSHNCRCKVVYGDNPNGPQLDERQLGYDDYDEEDFDVPVGAEADADAGANDDVAFMALSPLERVLKTVSQIDELPRRDDGGDVFLQAINDVRLNNRLPHAVTHDEIDHLVADDGYREVWRGVNGTSRTPASEYVDQFLTGDHYPGLGVHGNGTYTSTIRSTAESYGEGLIRIAIPPDARIIDVNDLADLREQAKSEWLAVRGSYDSNTQRLIDNILWEPGRFAAAAGYDGFTVAQTVTNPDELYVIVLNRAMLFVTRGSART